MISRVRIIYSDSKMLDLIQELHVLFHDLSI